jgi:hypothetical protein
LATLAPVCGILLAEVIFMYGKVNRFSLRGLNISLSFAFLLFSMSLSSRLHARPDAVNVTGVWDLTVESQEGTAHPSVTLKQEGERITGRYEGKIGASSLEGTVKGNEIRFSVNLKFQDVAYAVTYSGIVSEDSMKGTARFSNAGTGNWSARRRKSQA